ncbi:CASP-like protein 1b2 [Phtheirospermum japonicum]|uniref:CASP-like protein n=1 Tax=Phtheirospermum japonicum TaxID=374723 RepID=A0A830C2F4_9LAMI|nr:CASP-like protein 1b2 [Phtheirospermum japonicum]
MLIMALNKQTKTITVATIETVPIKATIVAKFQHTSAFVFFVIANGNASLHNLLMLGFSFVGHKFTSLKGLAPLAIPILDLINVTIVSGGASAAAFMGQLGRDGNSHARWNKICHKFNGFCDRGGGAMIASFFGLMMMIIVCSISIFRLQNNLNSHNNKLVMNGICQKKCKLSNVSQSPKYKSVYMCSCVHRCIIEIPSGAL